MSEDFLARWSRRKRDVAQAEEAAPPRPEDASTDAAEPAKPAEGAEAAAPSRFSEPVFDLKDLPSVESINATTDVRPFLVPGVPVDIARAALRRVWVTDPQIRDFVGLADYDWDYHAAGSAAGFGPLEMTDELRRAVARIIGGTAEEDRSAPARASPAEANSAEISCARGEVVSPAAAEGKLSPASHDEPSAPAKAVIVPSSESHAATQGRSAHRELSSSGARRGHGRALPK